MRLGDMQKKEYSNSISLPLVDAHSSFIHNDHKLDSYTLSINNRMDTSRLSYMGSSYPVRSQSLWSLPIDDTHSIPLKCWRWYWAGWGGQKSSQWFVLPGAGNKRLQLWSPRGLQPRALQGSDHSQKSWNKPLEKNVMPRIHSVYGIMKNSG